MKILVTGCAGFIGYHVVKKLLDANNEIVGVDSINNYYDQNLKKERLRILRRKALNKKKIFLFKKVDLSNKNKTENIFKKYRPQIVIHLAAQAGVRYSLKEPTVYERNNISAFTNIIENCRILAVKQLIYASSSSVYGANKKSPFKEKDRTDTPLQYYAATKKSNEIMAYTYSSLYKVPTVGIRFFTFYGPLGRPDMALYKFTKNILSRKLIHVHNNGNQARDFTYIDDAVDALINLINCFEKKDIKPKIKKIIDNKVPHFIINIGNSRPVKLKNFIKTLENEIGIKPKIKYLPHQKGEVLNTYADIKRAKFLIGFKNKTSLQKGIKNFVVWFRDYHK